MKTLPLLALGFAFCSGATAESGKPVEFSEKVSKPGKMPRRTTPSPAWRCAASGFRADGSKGCVLHEGAFRNYQGIRKKRPTACCEP